MADTEELSITVPAEVAESIREKVASGMFASSSDVVREAMQRWLHHEEKERRLAVIRDKIGAAADDAREIEPEEVQARLQQRHQTAMASRKR
jgi:antitoxin ParD1/3/4